MSYNVYDPLSSQDLALASKGYSYSGGGSSTKQSKTQSNSSSSGSGSSSKSSGSGFGLDSITSLFNQHKTLIIIGVVVLIAIMFLPKLMKKGKK